MAKTAPYLDGDKHTLDVDFDDEVNYVADVTQWLVDSATSTRSFTLVPEGATVLDQGLPQGELGGLLPVKLKVNAQPAFCTFRVTTTDNQQFDKTMHFKQVEN